MRNEASGQQKIQPSTSIGTKGNLVSFAKLKPSTKTISPRLPESVLNDIKLIANKRDVPYQTLIKIFLKERIDEEFRESA